MDGSQGWQVTPACLPKVTPLNLGQADITRKLPSGNIQDHI